ncbi:carbon monoxide dehydrogenase/acetyl-CoA synthase subunit beta [Oxobacter pfennigii]|uniref:Carbon monoxide dehydrogenase n=1 Tax=Oxobacter pfennigii TaxID=36849 RepID=A0A0P8YA41_9CLOT|nr:anaerobic carbon-monoxide dehydrogenase catalytic subunit [Oxobacter pfennigii]KPU43810.1 carbon monoxide dehydrogenase/acetyl-CoA synthase subunit beta [Oxobacter pfennigii]
MSTQEINRRTVDPAAAEMLEYAESAKMSTAWDRYKAQQPQCKFGLTGVCCRICIQGPCRIIPTKAGMDKGICGADVYTIVARNLVRYIAGGASAHSDHGREIAYTLLAVAEGHAPDYKITDKDKLMRVAKRVGVETEGREVLEIAKDVAIKALEDFGKYDHDPCTWLYTTIDEERKAKFKQTTIAPTAIDRSIAQLLHQTHIGVDADPVNIIFGGLRAALSDYTGMSLATDITDILFGTPVPVLTEANLGVLDPEKINIAVHGHNPLLSQMVVYAARELEAEAKAAGAKGINLVGICCTGNEVLMREGVPTATNFGSQELAIMTGVLDTMIMDVQCIAPGVKDICDCFHTLLVSTSNIAKIPGSYHVEFKEATAMEDAKKIIKLAIEQYAKRKPELVKIPPYKKQVVGGFSFEAMMDLFGKINPDSPISVLTDAIMAGEIKGVCAFAGCNNQKTVHDDPGLTIARELAKRDIFMVSTGCMAGAFAKAGYLSSEGVEAYAGPGLKKFIKRLEENSGLKASLPLVFHMGSCVDNSRIANLWTAMAQNLGITVPQLPFAASAPEAMSEKAISIGSWVISMGIPTHVGVLPPLEGSELVYGVATQIAKDVFGGYFMFETDPMKAAEIIAEKIEKRAWKLKILKETAEKYNSSLALVYEA